MNRQLQLVRAVALVADAIYDVSTEFGARMARQISGERGLSQIKGLEAIANSALRASDVLDYVKRQTARHNEWFDDGLGVDLLAYLTDGASVERYQLDNLYKKRDAIDYRLRHDLAGQGTGLDATERQQVTIMLYRQFVHQIAAHYQFQRRQVGRGPRHESVT